MFLSKLTELKKVIIVNGIITHKKKKKKTKILIGFKLKIILHLYDFP